MRATELKPSPEFELVLQCVRWPGTSGQGAAVRTLAGSALDWPRVLDIAACHQVNALVAHSLQRSAPDLVPEAPMQTLRQRATLNAQRCFERIAEVTRLAQLFRGRHIPLRVFKGVPLAMLAFRDPTLRDAGDIDLLVREQNLAAGEQLLAEAGYQRTEPTHQLSPRQRRSYLAHQKDFAFDHLQLGIALDLHWRLYRSPRLAAASRLDDLGDTSIALGPEIIPTLELPELLVYLCVHGALDGWLRLKWIADVGALASGMPGDQLAAVVPLASRQAVLPELSAGLLLAHRLLQSPLPEGCLDERDATVRRILQFASANLSANAFCPVRELVPNHSWFLHEFSLRKALPYRLNLIERALFRPRMMARLTLPDALFPLYAVLSPVEWLVFRLRRAAKLHRGPQHFAIAGRLSRTSLREAGLLLEAAALLTFFRVALKAVPVQRLVRWMGRNRGPADSAPAPDQLPAIRSIEWAVGAVARHAPLSFVCFPQSLAAYFMLRRRRIPSRLFYGVARTGPDQLEAHTWIKVGDRTVVGGEAEPAFTVLTSFP